MAPPRDLREWIALLEREGELHRITAEADPDLEITEITDRVVKAGGPALLFESPKGSEHPLLINQFGTERRMCMAFGVESLDDVAAKLGDVLEMQPPQGLVDKVKGLLKLKSIAGSLPKTTAKSAGSEPGDDARGPLHADSHERSTPCSTSAVPLSTSSITTRRGPGVKPRSPAKVSTSRPSGSVKRKLSADASELGSSGLSGAIRKTPLPASETSP